MTTNYQTVIGLEVHAQLLTESKIFCGCSTEFAQPPNTAICPVCSGQPGALPVLNQKVIDFALRMAAATRCTIRRKSRFARKNYFYPDLPKGYQISQYDEPLAEHGFVEIIADEGPKRINILRIHVEEDAGKSIHQNAANISLVDLNRAGVPLIEIVSEPDLRSPEEAAEYMRTLRGILRTLGICDGNMEQGSLRCDANVSLRPQGSQSLGTRTEIKNINSFKFVQRALAYEVERQKRILEEGEAVVQETRLFNAELGITESMRSKEEAHDYRYFPDPDLPEVVIAEDVIEKLQKEIPELPLARRKRFIEDLHLSAYDAEELTRERELADYFEETLAKGVEPKRAANWILTELLSKVDDARHVFKVPVSPAGLAGLLQLLSSGKVSGKLAKEIWIKMWESGKAAEQIALEENLFQQSNPDLIAEEVKKILADNPEQVAQYKAGKHKVLGFFVGQIMKVTRGKANPQMVNQLLKRYLDEE